MALTRAEFDACRQELARELAMRRNDYPRLVASGELDAKTAERQIRLLQVVYDVWCERHLPA